MASTKEEIIIALSTKNHKLKICTNYFYFLYADSHMTRSEATEDAPLNPENLTCFTHTAITSKNILHSKFLTVFILVAILGGRNIGVNFG